jgi:hypothetical protein
MPYRDDIESKVTKLSDRVSKLESKPKRSPVSDEVKITRAIMLGITLVFTVICTGFYQCTSIPNCIEICGDRGISFVSGGSCDGRSTSCHCK